MNKLFQKKIYLKNVIKFYLSKIFKFNNYFRYKSDFGKVFLDEINGGVSKIIAFYGTREDDKQILLKEAISSKTLYLDVGSNIGVFPVLISNELSDDDFLVSLEPDMRNHETLFKNLQNCLSNSIFLPYAVSNNDGKSKFFITKEPNLNYLINNNLNLKDKDNKNIITVNTITLETLFDKYIPNKFYNSDYSLLLRMDIEGGEYKVLDSLKKLLNDKNVIFKNVSIVYENHPPGSHKVFYKSVLEELLKIGFTFKCLICAGGLNIKDLDFLFGKNSSYRYIRSDNFVRMRINKPLENQSIKALTSQKKLIRYCVLEK